MAVSLMAGAGLGAIRAATVRIWRAQDGSAWRQGTMLTAALWLVSLATHLALDGIIDHFSRISALGTSTILVYLAVTLGVQREIVRRRAAPLAPGSGGTVPGGHRRAGGRHTDDRLNQMHVHAYRPDTGPKSVHAQP